MRSATLLLLLSAHLAAQSGTTIVRTDGTLAPAAAPNTPAPPAGKPEDLCGLEGQVVNAITGEPLRRASLVLNRTDVRPGDTPAVNYSTSSNTDGQFAMKDIEPGKYRLMATRNGFVSMAYGARDTSRPGTVLTLTRQQHLKDLVIKLTPHAVILGRVLDEEGEPVANARIMLQTYRYLQGRRQLANSGGGGGTNDLGEFRIFGVSPGKYYLSVTPAANGPGFAIDRSANTPEDDYVATYYPGTTDPAAATQLEATAGAQLRGIDLVLAKAHTVHVKGHVTHGLPGRQNVMVFLTPRNPSGMTGMLRNNQIDAAGNFDIRNVTPGAYTLTAVINDGNSARQGRIPVDVGSNSVEGLNVTIGPGAVVKGRIRVEGDAKTVDLSNVRASLQPRESGGMMFGGMSPGRVNEDGAFLIENAAPDRYNLVVFGLPANCYVKSIRAEAGDVLASGLDVSSGGAAPVEVVISPRAATVSGVVQNPNTNSPSPGATVVLIPQEKERRDQQTDYKMVYTDQNGAYTITGLTPGEYRAFAWEEIEFGAYMDPEFMKPLEGKGEVVSVQEADHKTIQLKLIPGGDSPAK